MGDPGQAVTVTGTLNGAERSEPTVVTVAVTGRTAGAGDFAAIDDFDLTIPANAPNDTPTFALIPVDDNENEDDETVEISGSTASALTITPTTLIITDNDEEPPVGVDDLYFTSFPGPRRPYHAGEVIEAEVKFGESVRITGMPQLTLNVGGIDRAADYYSTTGRWARFRYTVADGDMDTDGVSIDANSLSLNGGAIKDSMYRPTDLDHPAEEGGERHRVDGVKPILRNATLNGTTLTLTYNELLDTKSVPTGGQFDVSVDGVDRGVTSVTVSETTVMLTLTSAATLNQTVTMTYSVPETMPLRDTAGNAAVGLTAVPVKLRMTDWDVTGDGVFDGNDALVMAYAYRQGVELGNGLTGGQASHRQTLLGDLSGGSGADDAFLRTLLSKANDLKATAVSVGADVTTDGVFDGNDALAMLYAYRLRTLMGDGETGGSARYRRRVLEGLWGGSEPGEDTDFQAMLRTANQIRAAVR